MRGGVKRYGTRAALDGLDLRLQTGRWIGLLGPNGAGKTTAMLAIAGLIQLDAGDLELAGRPVAGPRPDVVGWVPQDLALYSALTARENLQAFGALHGVARGELPERVNWALRWIGLETRADQRVSTFSGGMRRRVNIAAAVLHRPALLLLDEPTVGVDPQARERIFAMLDELCRGGTTLLHSSHELDDVESICQEIIVMDGGRALASGSLHDLVLETVGNEARLTMEISGWSRRRLEVRLADPAAELPELIETVRSEGGRVISMDLRRPGLRDVFLQLTGRDLRE